tara:strand:- start:60 stop:515 length:456 start_codon:yes stop_codon:yes gene_type:complete
VGLLFPTLSRAELFLCIFRQPRGMGRGGLLCHRNFVRSSGLRIGPYRRLCSCSSVCLCSRLLLRVRDRSSLFICFCFRPCCSCCRLRCGFFLERDGRYSSLFCGGIFGQLSHFTCAIHVFRCCHFGGFRFFRFFLVFLVFSVCCACMWGAG